ncbi:MAG: threonine ammonia-lyase, partial [Aeromicrobium sp.]
MDISDLKAARELLRNVALTTPSEESRWLSRIVSTPVHLKCENLQRAGSFKIRGAYVRIARLGPEERSRGVVAASAGNHAQGVALAASLLGARATIFMPEGAALPKISATRAYGADIRFHGNGVTEALRGAMEFAEHTGAILIHPFDHDDIIAGQGTVGLEILEQVPDVRTILVPVGGGGLAAGISLIRSERPDIHVVGVQAEGAAAYPPSLREGYPVQVPMESTMAD